MKSILLIVLSFSATVLLHNSCDIDPEPDPQLFDSLDVQISITYPSEYLSEDGSIDLNITGGVTPYTISWIKDHPTHYTQLSNEEDLMEISTGMYYLRVDDQLGSTFEDSIFVATLDTIPPYEYLPVYPGSYWVYSNGDTIRTNPEYIKSAVFFKHSPPLVYDQGHGNNYFPNDSVYLPIWDGIPVLGYSSVNYIIEYIPLIPILTNDVGSTVFLSTDNRSSCSAFMTESLDTTLTIGNNTFFEVIQTSIWSMYHGSCWDYPDKRHMLSHSKRFYAKGVGLIREEIYKPNDPLIVKEIVDWYIHLDD